MTKFLARLNFIGVNYQLHFFNNGQIKGISYQLDGFNFPGYKLAKAYTFPALEKCYRDRIIEDQ